MRERVFNVFLFVTGNVIHEVGVTEHVCDGSDEDKIRLLQGKVNDDYRVCQRLPLPEDNIVVMCERECRRQLTYESFLTLQRLGRHMDFLEFVMEAVDAPAQPLLCITPIVDGVPRIERVTDLTPEMKPLQWN